MNFSQLVSEDGLFSDGDWIEKKDQDINGRVRLIQLADIGDGYFKDKSSRYVTEDTASRLNCTFLEQGDILIARLPDPLGRACIFPLKGQYITAVDIAILRIKNRLYNPRYIMYLINSPQFRKSISCYESGTTRKRISRRNLDKIQFNVPDITVQERIVSKIEELFSKLDASVEELKTAKEKLKVYRQAVLKEALTPEQGWCKCCFSDLMESVRNGYGKKPDDMGEYRILRISSVRPGKVELSDFRCNQTPFKEDDLISENDLLFTRYNGSLEYVGVCACVPQLQEKYAYPDKIIKCTPKLKNPYHSRFLQYSMNQGEARKYIRSKIKTTSGQKGIAGSDIKKVVLWLPELPVQEKIVKMIDEKMSTCDNIEQTIDISLRQAEAMRQSILKHAFKGGL